MVFYNRLACDLGYIVKIECEFRLNLSPRCGISWLSLEEILLRSKNKLSQVL